MNINTDRLILFFKTLVETDSPTLDERAVCDIIKQEFNNIGVNVVEDNASEKFGGSAGNLYAYIDGDLNLPPILFSAHMDTVEPSKNKKLIIDDDGKIHSDGKTVLGSDDFAGVSAILEALKTIRENNISHRPIEILFSVSEENYCKGISEFDFSKIKSKEAYVFDLSGKVGGVAYKAPTILSFKLEVFGKASHAGFAPQDGVHAIKAVSTIVSKINCGKIDDDTTVNIGTIAGGSADNIVPDYCTLTGEIRSYIDDKAVKQYENIENIARYVASEFNANYNISLERNVTAYETPLDHMSVKRFKNSCDTLSIKSELVSSFGGSDNNVFAQNKITGLVVATAMNDCHSTSEWTTVDELKNATKIAYKLMTSKE